MSPQVLHALKQAGIMVAIAALGALIQSQTDVLQALQIDPIWWPVIGAALAAAVRWFEGLMDADRAEAGIVVPSDVAYDYLKEQAANPMNPDVRPDLTTRDIHVTQ